MHLWQTKTEHTELKVLEIADSAVTVSNITENYTLVVASYSGNKLTDVKFITTASATKTFEELGLLTDEATEIKAMLWDGMDSMKPVCKAVSSK